MLIEESVTIRADAGTVWKTFTDISCWQDWSRVFTDVSAQDKDILEEGARFSFCIRPFAVPVRIRPVVEEVVPGERIVWSGYVFGVRARHEYVFEQVEGGVRVTSREKFKGLRVSLLMFLATKWRLRQLTADVLMELKSAAESSAAKS